MGGGVPWPETVAGMVALLLEEEKSAGGFCLVVMLCASMYIERAQKPDKAKFLHYASETYKQVETLKTVGDRS